MGQGTGKKEGGGKPTTIPVQLGTPVTQGEEEYRVLEIRKPKARDLRDLPMQPKMGDMFNLVADLAGVPYSVIDELDWADTEKVMDVVGNFMPAGRRTGKKK